MRDTILFDINETVLDLSSLKPTFKALFGTAQALPTWFATLLHSSTVSALTGVRTNFADLALVTLNALAADQNVSLNDNTRQAFLNGFSTLKPHHDVIPALQTLKDKGYRRVA